jgi:hypothetical protein
VKFWQWVRKWWRRRETVEMRQDGDLLYVGVKGKRLFVTVYAMPIGVWRDEIRLAITLLNRRERELTVLKTAHEARAGRN